MTKYFKYLFVIFCLFIASPARAMTEEELRLVSEIEFYLNRIDTAVADFVQVSPSGAISSGKFFLHRPGRLRWQYDPPTPILIVADGNTLIYYDFELEEVSRVDMEDTLAGFLARRIIDFDHPETRLTEIENRAGVVRLTVRRTSDPHAGSLTLIFQRQPLALRKLEVEDAQQQVTHVSLNNMQFGLDLAEELFEFQNPRMGRRFRN